jgi:hypothetical protein
MNFEEIINGLPSQNMLLETLLWRGFAVETYQSGLLLHAQSHEQDADILEACGLDIQRTERVDESDRLFIAPQPTPDSLLKRIFELPARNGMVGAPQIDDAFETFKSNEFGPRLDTEGLDPGTALLVKALNHVGVYTVMSCDGHGVQAPQIWLRTRWDYLWCRHALHEVWPLACRQNPWTDCKLPDAVLAACEHPEGALWEFSEDPQAGWLRYSFTWEQPGFDEELEISNPVFWLIQSFARELLRSKTSSFLRRRKATLNKNAFLWLEHMGAVAPGLEASVESCILYLTNSGKQQELVDHLVSLKMQLDLFD